MRTGHKYRCIVIQNVPGCSSHMPAWFCFQTCYLFSFLFASLGYFNIPQQLEPRTSKITKKLSIILEEKVGGGGGNTQGKFRVLTSSDNAGFFLIL